MWLGARRWVRRGWVAVIIRVWPLARLWYGAWGLPLDGGPDDTVWYFAYGANMHDDAFLERRRMNPKEWRVGRIENYRLRFNLEGRPKGRAAPANIGPEPGGEVRGVLYRITRRELVRLNASEGVPGGRYRPTQLDVEDDLGAKFVAISYVAEGRKEDGKPSLRYITLLREGARAHGLPRDYRDFLERVEPAK